MKRSMVLALLVGVLGFTTARADDGDGNKAELLKQIAVLKTIIAKMKDAAAQERFARANAEKARAMAEQKRRMAEPGGGKGPGGFKSGFQPGGPGFQRGPMGQHAFPGGFKAGFKPPFKGGSPRLHAGLGFKPGMKPPFKPGFQKGAQPEQGQAAEKLEHLRAAAKHLNAAGMKDIAREIVKHAENLEREIRKAHHPQNKPGQFGPQGMPDVMQAIQQLRKQVEQLQKSVNELQKRR